MDVGSSPAKTILEKPLNLLTEEDISQLTREDCRQFLKHKGMRRPSWNKSQAIQQVLSLKALFEHGEDSGAGILRKILVSQPVTTTSMEPTKDFRVDGRIPFPEDDGPFHCRDSPRSAEYSGGSYHYVAEKDRYKTFSPRSPAETSASVGQMTIFYCGKVNVFNGVPPEKERSIMHFAANPMDFPGPMSKEKMLELPQYVLEVPKPSDVEGRANRKVSLQRYLNKRKDRFSKTKRAQGVASSSLEMFLNRQPRMNTPYSRNCSLTRDPPHVVCESPENKRKSSHLLFDLNKEGKNKLNCSHKNSSLMTCFLDVEEDAENWR